ncbi:CLUMA_CG010512, isoform A [Clunio marinus]|uniref:CLUMA_CG010512, isoform A n=1 Tax=Clunio marinus TaxID=568069 RepID=A0A1J1IF39_9DIPT|nr:CLUMA_CG010512, isoform A [Clunio marinus]
MKIFHAELSRKLIQFHPQPSDGFNLHQDDESIMMGKCRKTNLYKEKKGERENEICCDGHT